MLTVVEQHGVNYGVWPRLINWIGSHCGLPNSTGKNEIPHVRLGLSITERVTAAIVIAPRLLFVITLTVNGVKDIRFCKLSLIKKEGSEVFVVDAGAILPHIDNAGFCLKVQSRCFMPGSGDLEWFP